MERNQSMMPDEGQGVLNPLRGRKKKGGQTILIQLQANTMEGVEPPFTFFLRVAHGPQGYRQKDGDITMHTCHA